MNVQVFNSSDVNVDLIKTFQTFYVPINGLYKSTPNNIWKQISHNLQH